MIIRFDPVLLKVRTPLHHGGDEKTGSEVALRRLKYLVDDRVIEVPYIDGNALRGYTRRLLMKDLLDQVGYTLRSVKLYHTLFSGGLLEEVREGGTLNLELRRTIRRLLPPVSLYGCSMLNQVFTGKLIVGKCLPVCSELREYIPIGRIMAHSERFREIAPARIKQSFYEYLDWCFATRRAEEEAREKRKPGEQPVQMIYRYEVFIPGTLLYTWFHLVDANPVEQSCFSRMIELFKEQPFIGGRSAIGCGEVELEIDLKNLSPKLYMKFLEEHRGEIAKLLMKLEEMLGS